MAEINLEDLKPNSHKYKEEQKMEREQEDSPKKPKLRPVVDKENLVQSKKSLGQQFKETFIQEDVKTVRDYVIDEVVVPGFKNLILDCLSMFFFKESYEGKRGRKDDYDDYTMYYKSGKKKKKKKKRDYDEDDEDDERLTDYRNIVVKRRDDAEEVVKELRRRIKKYDKASVADLFDLIGKTGKYTDNNWGWTDKEDIGIRRVPNGYLIDVAEAELLDD